jgi:uncharacterized protein (DUF1015 family)
MADIRPFMSIRPEKGKAAKIAALPYDVYNRKEATEEVEKNPESFLKIDRAETGYPLSVDMYDDRVYERAHDLLWGMVELLLYLRTYDEWTRADRYYRMCVDRRLFKRCYQKT